MKKTLLTALAVAALSIGTQAQATPFWENSMYNNTLNAKVPGIMGLDWSSSGSGVGALIGPFGNATALAPGNTFDFMYQASLVGVTDKNGQPVTFPLTTGEYTIAAKMKEEVVSLTALDLNPLIPGNDYFTALFKTISGQYYIYNDAVKNSNVASGFGFDDGTVAASGTIDPGLYTIFTANLSNNQGAGSTILTGTSTADTNYFTNGAPSEIISFRFESNLNYPALDSTTANFFTGRAGEGNFDPYTVGPGDLMLKVDASSKFTPVPEPSTMLLLGMGLFGAAVYSRRKKTN